MEKTIAIVGNGATILLASVAQDAMWWMAAFCSLCTSVYMLAKLFMLWREHDKNYGTTTKDD